MNRKSHFLTGPGFFYFSTIMFARANCWHTSANTGKISNICGILQVSNLPDFLYAEFRTPIWADGSLTSEYSIFWTPYYLSDVSRVFLYSQKQHRSHFQVNDHRVMPFRHHTVPKLLRRVPRDVHCNTHNRRQFANSKILEDFSVSEPWLPHKIRNTSNGGLYCPVTDDNSVQADWEFRRIVRRLVRNKVVSWINLNKLQCPLATNREQS